MIQDKLNEAARGNVMQRVCYDEDSLKKTVEKWLRANTPWGAGVQSAETWRAIDALCETITPSWERWELDRLEKAIIENAKGGTLEKMLDS